MKTNLFILVSVIMLLIVDSSCTREPDLEPTEVFKTYVLDPIPDSVTNIKADQPRWFRGYIYVLKFNINRDDLTKIIESRPFERAWYPKYNYGSIDCSWDIGNTADVIVYHPQSRHRIPKWFSPEWPDLKPSDEYKFIKKEDGNIDVELIKNDKLSGHSEVYAYMKIGDKVNKEFSEHVGGGWADTQVLLYSEEKSEAYFIVSKVRY